ncbi:hypothetical protein [Amycolatopsis sp. cmx-11-12]|uniref:hypothetical protein n=1 Tax=Amycolatopsis sp. cmx-11-12 TaxID=2785795 RepID=UPI003917C1C1
MKKESLAGNRNWWHWSAAVGLVRMPPAMAALALAFAGVHVTGSYGIGAALAACYALGEAVSAPWRGRSVDNCAPRTGIARMTWALLGSAATLSTLAWAVWGRWPVAWLFALTAVAAILPSGLPGGFRAMLTGLLDPVRLRIAFRWDAAILEAEWFLAPLAVSAVLLAGTPALALAAMAGCALAGAATTRRLAVVTPENGPPPAALSPGIDAARRAWRSPAAWPTYLNLGLAEGVLIAVLPALLLSLGTSSTITGVFAVASSAGSFPGGVLLAALMNRLVGQSSIQADIALVLMGLFLFPAIALSSAPWLVGPAGSRGLFIAPVNALRSQALERALPMDSCSEGFSIQYAAHGLGVALGSFLVAILVSTNP